MNLSKKDLIATAQRYYESSKILVFTPEMSFEAGRRHELWAQWIENMDSWRAFRASLRSELPSYDIGETYSTHDGGPRCIIYPPRGARGPSSNWIVVGCVSILAPVYFVYGVECDYADGRLQNDRVSFDQPPPGMSFPAQVVARTIEKTFGFSAVSREIVETPVHLFAGWREPPETTLFHALFTNAPSRIP